MRQRSIKHFAGPGAIRKQTNVTCFVTLMVKSAKNRVISDHLDYRLHRFAPVTDDDIIEEENDLDDHM